MNHNPYAPPQSEIADLEPEEGSMIARPRSVTIAVSLCWLWLLITVPGIIVATITAAARFPGNTYIVANAILFVFFCVLVCTLIVFIGRGRRWARIIFCSFAGLSLLSLRSGTLAAFGHGRVFGVLSLLGTALSIAVIVLLFLPASSIWFSAVSAARRR